MTNNSVNVLNIKKRKNIIIPKRVTIETIFGCNAKCIMCPIDLPTKRKKGIMPLETFKSIIDSLIPYRENFEMTDLYSLGEPLLDPHIFERINYVKEKGFRNLGISTNAALLNYEKQCRLLESGIDTIIFSIDGVKKETHEKIRRGINFEQVIENCLSIIRMRNEHNYRTRFVIRFIRQDINRHEWETFKQFWINNISKGRSDFITAFDVHSWGGEVFTKESILRDSGRIGSVEKKACPIIFDVLYILADGTVPLCNEDWHEAVYSFGNVTNNSPIEIFNCNKFNKIREIHKRGNKYRMDICRECTVNYSMENKEIF